MKAARIYLRVSSDDQDLARQTGIERAAAAQGYYIAGVYREKASGARADRPELQRMIADLQPGDVVIAENIDRISRLPLDEAEQLIARIRATGAKLAIPGVVDLSELVADSDGVAKIVLEAVQAMLLKIALQIARDDYDMRRRRQFEMAQLAKSQGRYTGRKTDQGVHDMIIALRTTQHTVKATAKLAGCSESQVKRVWAIYLDKILDKIAEQQPQPN